jgi:type IV secretion system protein VirB9
LPRRPLDPQSFFLRTEWCPDGPGLPSCEPGEYAIELHTQADRVGDARIKEAFFGIQYRYTTRETAWRLKKAAEARQEAGKRAREWRENNPPPALPSVPDPASRWDLAVCSTAPEVTPDAAWTDGRTTFLRYNGTRRLPNVYERRDDGVETLIKYEVEPEAFGNVIRIGKVRPFFYLRDGDRASCLINVQQDVEGRHEMAVAPILRPLAGRPRRGAP